MSSSEPTSGARAFPRFWVRPVRYVGFCWQYLGDRYGVTPRERLEDEYSATCDLARVLSKESGDCFAVYQWVGPPGDNVRALSALFERGKERSL